MLLMPMAIAEMANMAILTILAIIAMANGNSKLNIFEIKKSISTVLKCRIFEANFAKICVCYDQKLFLIKVAQGCS